VRRPLDSQAPRPDLAVDGVWLQMNDSRNTADRPDATAVLVQVAEAVSMSAGEGYEQRLAARVAEILGVKGALVALAEPGHPDRLRSCAFVLEGKACAEVCYSVVDTPCEQVLLGEARVDERDLAARFPRDPMVADFGLQSYAGVPVRMKGAVVGLVAVFDDAPLHRVELVLSVLRILALRIAGGLERRQSEAALAAAERMTRLVLESVGEGVLALGPDGRVLMLNPAAAHLLDWPAAELVGRQSHEAIHHHRADGAPYPPQHCPILRTLQDGRIRRVDDEVFFRRDGTPLPVEYVCAPLRGEDGAVAGAVVSFSDVRERRRAELALRERIKELRCLYRVLEITTDGARSVPEACTEVLATLPGSMQHEADTVARIEIEGESFECAGWRQPAASLRATVRHGRETLGEVEVGYTSVQPDAGDGLGPFFREEKDLVEAVASHLARMLHARRMAEQLAASQRLESLGQLTGGLAHDFNNLLTVILGSAEALADELRGKPGQRGLADMIVTAAQRGADLTQRLLAFARKQALAPQPLDLNRQLAGMDAMLRRTLGAGIAIEQVHGAGLWTALADPAQLESAVLNLCINARDAMPDGGRLTIETGNAHLDRDYTDAHPDLEPGPYVMLAVSDTGSGMTPEQRERAFEPFYTTKERGRGTGLGLPMVHGFVKQSGGHVSIYSEPGEGTTVRLYLPRHCGPVLPQEQGPRGSDSRGRRILLVEDNPMVREFACGQLRALGHEVREAANGREALALLEGGEHFDLLFTDVVMPGGMSGSDLAEAARGLRPGLPVLFTSGYTENAVLHQGRLERGVLLLAKPYRRADLERMLREALRHA
jgi:PAS domain S-box-containing protein